MNISNLIIEVTRKCNMTCAHCLRGDAMAINMKKEYIDSLLAQIDSIGSVTFSGGEPSLNLEIMEYFLSECKRKRMNIGSFYIATNGIKISTEFVIFCLNMYAYCDEKEMCQVEVSNDYYHIVENTYDDSLLRGLSFFSKRNKKDGDNINLIAEGGSTEGSKERVSNDIDFETFQDETEVYLNCLGDIINGCNWSYKNQKKHKLCNVTELTRYAEKLTELVEVYA